MRSRRDITRGWRPDLPRRAAWRFALAALALVLAWQLVAMRRAGDGQPAAAARAAHVFAAYLAASGNPARHFGPPRVVRYDDGWEFSWVYLPCADIAALRVFVPYRGAARYQQLPDCTPRRGLGVPLETT